MRDKILIMAPALLATAFAWVVLTSNPTENDQYVESALKSNKDACNENDGIYSIEYVRGSLHKLILCNDGTVKWNKNK